MTLSENDLRRVLHDAAPDLGAVDVSDLDRPHRTPRLLPVVAGIVLIIAVASLVTVIGMQHTTPTNRPVAASPGHPSTQQVSSEQAINLGRAAHCRRSENPNNTQPGSFVGRSPRMIRFWRELADFRTAVVVTCGRDGISFTGQRTSPDTTQIAFTNLQPFLDVLARPVPPLATQGCFDFADGFTTNTVLVNTAGDVLEALFPRNSCGHLSEPGPDGRQIETVPAERVYRRLRFTTLTGR